MKTVKTSRLFERKQDKISGVPYYILTEKKCAYQQGFYFVNNSITLDGRYLWFYTAESPVYDASLRNMGYVDFLTDEVVICHDIIIDDTSPYVDPQTGTVYYTKGASVYMREPGKDKAAKKLCTVPFGGYIRTIASHLTPLSDGKSFLLDIQRYNFGNIQGTINIETGEFTEWSRCDHQTAHGQINPKNDALGLFAYESHVDLATGKKVFGVPIDENGVYQRLWTITADGVRTCYPARDNYASHEWWSADGKKIFYVNDFGIQRLDLTTGEHICVHECYPWHAHTTKDENYYVFDEKVLDRYDRKWFRGCPAAVKFYNRITNKEIAIVTEMPENGFSPSNQCTYHIDPHPRFTDDEKYIVFTTTELGGVDLAVAVVDELVALTK